MSFSSLAHLQRQRVLQDLLHSEEGHELKVSVYDMCPRAGNNLHKGRAHKIEHTQKALNKLKMHDTKGRTDKTALLWIS